MASKLPAFPELPQHSYSVALGETAPEQYQCRLTYRLRTEGWYIDITRPDGTALAEGRRISPGWGPILGITLDGAPEGILYVRGPSRYTRLQWGAELELLSLQLSEIETTTEAALAVTFL